MFKSKFVAIAAAATLAITPGLIACGGQQTSSSSSSEATSSVQSSSSDAALAGDPTVAEWGAEGATNDGSFGVLYFESRPSDVDKTYATVVFKETTSGVVTFFNGEFIEKDGTCTLTDTETGIEVTYTTPQRNTQTGEVKMTFSDKGDATLTAANNISTVRKDMAQTIAEYNARQTEQPASTD